MKVLLTVRLFLPVPGDVAADSILGQVAQKCWGNAKRRQETALYALLTCAKMPKWMVITPDDLRFEVLGKAPMILKSGSLTDESLVETTDIVAGIKCDECVSYVVYVVQDDAGDVRDVGEPDEELRREREDFLDRCLARWVNPGTVTFAADNEVFDACERVPDGDPNRVMMSFGSTGFGRLLVLWSFAAIVCGTPVLTAALTGLVSHALGLAQNVYTHIEL